MSAGTPLLEINSLSTEFPTAHGLVRAVDDVSLAIAPGRTLGLVGESGCGKTVLMRTLMGLLPASARISPKSRVRFDGREIDIRSERALRRIRGREISMIFQDPMSSLNPVMSVGTQIGEALRLNLGMRRRAARARAIELLAAVGIALPERRVDQYPHQLSGGIRQRVAIAIALASEPRLLIADEPTTALDVTVQAEILDLLQRQQRERRMAMVLITHDLGVVAGRADDIAVMYAGKIVERAPVRELFANTRMPYTKALLESIPRLDDKPRARLKTIPGRPPDPGEEIVGCGFAARCPEVRARCRREAPVLASDGKKSHTFACWYPVSGKSKPS